MLNLWIEVAIESKTALGNMYGFSGLMYGLCMPQVFIEFIYDGPSFQILLSIFRYNV